MPRTWFITGCSSGFGHEITKIALARGDNVVATSRNASALEDLKRIGAWTASLDVTAPARMIEAVVAESVKKYGTIDVLVNNAGYVLEGGIEEISDDEAKAQFNTNVFGQLSLTRAILPYMRAKRSGTIAFMGSVAGRSGASDYGLYCASKFAVAAIAESLHEEVRTLGIAVVAVEPGYFRTPVLSGGHKVVAQTVIEDMKRVLGPMKERHARLDGTQPGDPEKGAGLIVDALTGEGACAGRKGPLPKRLLLGSDAVALVMDILEKEKRVLDEWRDLAVSTDFVEDYGQQSMSL